MTYIPHLNKIYFLLSLLLLGACTAQNKTMTTEKDIIQDTYWMLYSMEGEDLQGPIDTRTAYIRFEEGKDDVKGYTGCNNFFGKYALSGDSVRLSKLGATKMMCPTIEQENQLMGILERVDSYSISDYLLTLYSGGTAVATFRAGNDRGEVVTEQ